MTGRARNKPWKRIYGTDRKYTARVDRALEREAARAWEEAESDPRFIADVEAGLADVKAGRVRPLA